MVLTLLRNLGEDKESKGGMKARNGRCIRDTFHYLTISPVVYLFKNKIDWIVRLYRRFRFICFVFYLFRLFVYFVVHLFRFPDKKPYRLVQQS
jgi:hypothetical protein